MPESSGRELALPAAALAMREADEATRALGIELLEVEPGFARLRMRVQPHFLNALGICHGGYLFMLADSAFAFACNSHNQKAVSANASIDFLAPARADDVMEAVATEVHRGGRSGLYDVRVTDQSGRLLATLRVRSATIRGTHVEDPAK